VLVIEHNMAFARLVSERMIALDFGEVIASGSCDEVLGSRRLQKAYFGLVGDEEAPPVEAADARQPEETAR
jgi:ABC-type uncharacterized transport system ATPase subunit